MKLASAPDAAFFNILAVQTYCELYGWLLNPQISTPRYLHGVIPTSLTFLALAVAITALWPCNGNPVSLLRDSLALASLPVTPRQIFLPNSTPASSLRGTVLAMTGLQRSPP
jgi:hypothetical protein